MKNLKKLLAIGLVAALSSAAILSGCTDNNGNGEAGASEGGAVGTEPTAEGNADTSLIGEGMQIEVVSKGFQVDFWQMVNKGCMAAGEDLGASVNFVGPASEANIEEQVQQLQNAINKKPDAICFAPLDPASSLDLIVQTGTSGTPIVTFDATFDENEYDTKGAVSAFVATNNIKAGATAAQEMYNKLGDRIQNPEGTVRIAVMSQDTTSESVHQRNVGFIDKMVELCGAETTSVTGHTKYANEVASPKVIIDVGIPAETTDAAGLATAQNLLNNNDLIGFYGSNEFSAKAMVNANEGLNKLGVGDDQVIGVGFDSGTVQTNAIRNEVLYGAITQDPYNIGYLVVQNAVTAAAGQEVSDTEVPHHFYTAANIDNDEIASCLYA